MKKYVESMKKYDEGSGTWKVPGSGPYIDYIGFGGSDEARCEVSLF